MSPTENSVYPSTCITTIFAAAHANTQVLLASGIVTGIDEWVLELPDVA